MKNEFLANLHRLKLDLDSGVLSPEEYTRQRKALLDAFEPEDDLDSTTEGFDLSGGYSTQSEFLDTEDTVSEHIDFPDADASEERSTVEVLFDHTQTDAAPPKSEPAPSARPAARATPWIPIVVGLLAVGAVCWWAVQ